MAALDDATSCAICLESAEFITLPCCSGSHTQSSTTRFCLECVTLLCDHAGGNGRCPRCRAWIGIEDGAVVERAEQDQCRICCQLRVLVDNGTCDACSLGMRYPLRYKCQRCDQTQRIGHPMWRYQETPGSYGTVTWACHRRCHAQTHWRIVAADVGRVPDGDAPESWGRRDEWLQTIREYRLRVRAGREGGAPGDGEEGRRCSIS